MPVSSIILTMPTWIDPFLDEYHGKLTSDEMYMRLVIGLSRENCNQQTGGPFAAVVFDTSTGSLVAAGVNRVVPCNCSMAHAEMMALALAQQRLSTFNLSAPGLPPLVLYTSTEPCAMCLGAIPWSGIKNIVCSATDEDARAAGFDEGAKPPDWIAGLAVRGISVRTGLLRSEAAGVLREYALTGGLIYNGTAADNQPAA